jgi:hypothetical protein
MSIGVLNGNTYGLYLIKASLTPVEVATITSAEQNFTVAGLKVGDMVQVNPPGLTAGASLSGARVSAANTLTLTFVNPTAGNVTPLAGVYTIQVFRPEGAAAKVGISD